MSVVYRIVNPHRVCKLCGRTYMLTSKTQTRHVCANCVTEYRRALQVQESLQEQRHHTGVLQVMAICENRGFIRTSHHDSN